MKHSDAVTVSVRDVVIGLVVIGVQFAGAALSFGIGLLFYSVIDFGVISTVIYVLAFTSSATGAAASAYYGCRYFSTKRKLGRIMDLGKNATLKGGILDDSVLSEIEFRY